MKTILFFDTETASFKGPIMQLAYVLFNENGEEMAAVSHKLKHPEPYEVHEGAFETHGMTYEECQECGVDAIAALSSFLLMAHGSDAIVAHNLSFDWEMVNRDRNRYALIHEMPSAGIGFCTMKSTTDICKLPGKYGYKWPKLQELHAHLFGTTFEGAHDALSDVRATARCYFELKRRGIIQ